MSNRPSDRITAQDFKDHLKREKISFEEYVKRFLVKRGYLKEDDDDYESETDTHQWIREAMEE